ncbi:threonine ammonia-lyase IlvA [Daejeonella oryzae]|uniref:threonine ammonia-lyase IlvA n=1 Tax=Daejeonella oryzae TaxID=1122943 RepID=UPI000424D278|nr:threonine ammonia-lyase IlvA [Daejeonella oryzae]
MENDTQVFNVQAAAERLKDIVKHTPLEFHAGLSAKYNCNIYLKREDLQVVRSYKLRGAFNMISALTFEEAFKGVVCASAGNHAQGVAYSCQKLGIKGTIFMPEITPKQKIKQTRMFGAEWIEIVLTGDTFDDCLKEALKFSEKHQQVFIPPFDHPGIVEGQATVGMEILKDLPETDVIIMPVGGGGLAAGVGSYIRDISPLCTLIGVEPEGAPSMSEAFLADKPVLLKQIDRFIDGAAVKRAGTFTFPICKEVLDKMILVPEGKVCSVILELYNENAIVAEPAGALSVAALDQLKDSISGKNVVCIISGGNNDIERMQEIKERSLLYEGLKHYFIISFPQRPGALKDFVNLVLGRDDDITRFEFIKKTNRERGPALVGIELGSPQDYLPLVHRMELHHFDYKAINGNKTLFEFLV